VTTRPHLVLALLAARVLPAGEAAAEAMCTPSARVGGDPALVGPVVDLLRERGIPVGPNDCGEIVAVLARDAGHVRVSVTDADGRGVERVADDVESTATLIESFARSDVSAPLLAARALPAEPSLRADREAPPSIRQAAPVVASAPRRIELGAAAELGLSGDGAVWTAARAQGCIGIGALCTGVLVRYADDTDRSGDSQALRSGRWALDLIVLADLPLRRGAFVLTPGIGMGLSIVRSERELFDETTEEETSAMDLRGHVAGGTLLGGGWSLQLDLGLDVKPLARTRIGPHDDKLAGAPRTQGWLGVVLAYGGL
jgi:hypothetical protein